MVSQNKGLKIAIEKTGRKCDKRFMNMENLQWQWLLLTVILITPIASLSETIESHPPGKLIKVNGRNMHIHCIGQKNPTIILDSGAGGFSLEWSEIQNNMARYSRVCTYDRAGYGWSDMGDLPRTTKNIAHELHLLLEQAGLRPPYIIAGHSFGGFTAQYFSRYFSNEVIGIVLIDSSHEEQIYRLPENRRSQPRYIIDQQRRNLMTKVMLHENFPKSNAAIAYRLMNQQKSLLTWREELASYPISSRQLSSADELSITNIPLVVLTRGKRLWPHNDHGNAMENIWMELQKELKYLSHNSKQIIAEHSGHAIHLDEPELVIDALHDVLYAYEKSLQDG